MLGIDNLSKPVLVGIAVFIYLLGVCITTVVCHKLKWEEEDIPGVAWFYPIALLLWVVFQIFCIPQHIYHLLDSSDSAEEDDYEADDYYEDRS